MRFDNNATSFLTKPAYCEILRPVRFNQTFAYFRKKKHRQSQELIDWLIPPKGQKEIAKDGPCLFLPQFQVKFIALCIHEIISCSSPPHNVTIDGRQNYGTLRVRSH